MNIATIEILNHDKCTGCSSCYNICPTSAITMEYNKEGFLYPSVNENICIECKVCQKKCPELVYNETERMFHNQGICVAAMADDELRMKSSSGGIFSLLAERIYDENGVVSGAIYSDDYKRVFHILSSNREDLEKLRGSKYVQSEIGSVYVEIKNVLREGRKVLFVGTPCQVAGLYTYLGGKNELLYTVDLVCHGANSVSAYQSYISEVANGRKIEKVDFRDKSEFGWSTPVTIYFKDGTKYSAAWNKNNWNPAFLGGIINRECCSECHYAQGQRISDITLGDFWQIQRLNENYNDWKGTSLVLLNTEKGHELYKQIVPQLKLNEEASLDFAKKYNGQLVRPNAKASGRRFFFNHLEKDGYHKALWYGREWRYDVGLIGWWFSANYGSVLTYYALGKVLLDMDLLPIMIRIPKIDGGDWENITNRNIEFMKKYFYVSKPRIYEKMREVNQFCDSFMLGSDQLWVSNYNKLVGYTFYLDFANENKKKIAYATSLGYDKYNGDLKDTEIVKILLSRFDAISVRERSGVDICKDEFNVSAERMLDPVFLCDIKNYDDLAKVSKINEEELYILCYILDPTDEKRQAIRVLEERYNIKSLIVLDMKTYDDISKRWQGENILSVEDVGIEEFIYLIKHSQYLFTDSHHGVCFGMIYHKNFSAVANSRRGKTRFDSLFHLFEMEDCLLEEGDICTDIQKVHDINYDVVDKILEKERQKSLKWLKNALEKSNNKKQIREDLFAEYFNKVNQLTVENRKLRKLIDDK